MHLCVCGPCSLRKAGNRVAVWTKTCEDEKSCMEIGEQFKSAIRECLQTEVRLAFGLLLTILLGVNHLKPKSLHVGLPSNANIATWGMHCQIALPGQMRPSRAGAQASITLALIRMTNVMTRMTDAPPRRCPRTLSSIRFTTRSLKA